MGGTNYYIESVLWKVLLDAESSDADSDSAPLLFDEDVKMAGEGAPMAANISDLPFCTPDAVDHLSSAHLHQLLKTVDPVMADILHPNNRRKVIR